MHIYVIDIFREKTQILVLLPFQAVFNVQPTSRISPASSSSSASPLSSSYLMAALPVTSPHFLQASTQGERSWLKIRAHWNTIINVINKRGRGTRMRPIDVAAFREPYIGCCQELSSLGASLQTQESKAEFRWVTVLIVNKPSTSRSRAHLKVNQSIILDLPVRILLKVNDSSS